MPAYTFCPYTNIHYAGLTVEYEMIDGCANVYRITEDGVNKWNEKKQFLSEMEREIEMIEAEEIFSYIYKPTI